MTHMRRMDETEGRFGARVNVSIPCRRCGEKVVTTEVWTSSCGGYKDAKYTCGACGFVWWVDGPDA